MNQNAIESLIQKYRMRPVAPGMTMHVRENGKKFPVGDAVAFDPKGISVKYFTADMLREYDTANTITESQSHDDTGSNLKLLNETIERCLFRFGGRSPIEIKIQNEVGDERRSV